MDKNFEILNQKINMLFEELMWLRSDFQREVHKKEIKELEYKVQKAQDELNYKKDDTRFNWDRLDDVRKRFNSIERDIEFYNQRVEEVER